MSIKKTLLMLTLNYILIFAWMYFFRLGEFSALILFPITMGIAFLDTVLSEGRMSAYIWCGNLLIATIAGLLLQAYLYVRETGDIDGAVIRLMVEIPVAIVIIAIAAIISGHEAAKLKRRRKSIVTVKEPEVPAEKNYRVTATINTDSAGRFEGFEGIDDDL
ncbi:MAG: hypothetical protein K5668_01330, partial [Lachnospiraceae bacterium]|nr:hypothetical protein [Lachnospiraceae bacterium]